jgi:Tfp pilus assembly protein PilF
MQQHTTAERHIAKALLHDPSYAQSYNDLANVFIASGRTKEASKAFEIALNQSREGAERMDVYTSLLVSKMQDQVEARLRLSRPAGLG